MYALIIVKLNSWCYFMLKAVIVLIHDECALLQISPLSEIIATIKEEQDVQCRHVLFPLCTDHYAARDLNLTRCLRCGANTERPKGITGASW